ncbi:hypothetical protein P3T21_000734 [Paraburkholderia sp. GAS334]
MWPPFLYRFAKQERRLNLRHPAIDEQFDAVHKTRVVGREKHGGLCDLIRCAGAPERNLRGEIIQQALLLRGVRPGKVETGSAYAVPACASFAAERRFAT